jgi:hypothetical protein
MNELENFVKEVANEHPIHSWNEHNECKFCGQSWAERTYEEYLEMGERMKLGETILRLDHHYDDCLWVRANELIRKVMV